MIAASAPRHADRTLTALRPVPTGRVDSPMETRMKPPIRRLRTTLLAATWCAVAAAPLQSALAQDAVTIGLAIPLTAVDGGTFAVAEELGLFKEERLTVSTIVLQGAGVVIPQVAAKQLTIGFPLPEPVLASHETGKDPLPVRYFYNALPLNVIELAVLEEGPIKTIDDLKGKKIGVGALTWGTIPSTKALLRSAGMTPGKDVEIVAVGILGSGFHALRTGRVEALNYNHSWHDMLELSGTKIRRLKYPPTFERMISNGFIAHTDTLQNNPDLLARFGRAFTKAQLACAANTRNCIEAFWRRNPEARPKEGDPAKNLADAVTLLERRMDKILKGPDGKELAMFGQFDTGVIKEWLQQMAKAGEFNTADMPVDRIFSNALVPEFNKFDREAIRARARLAK
jgi:NitT/TauT family transport system substrate-binding protein